MKMLEPKGAQNGSATRPIPTQDTSCMSTASSMIAGSNLKSSCGSQGLHDRENIEQHCALCWTKISPSSKSENGNIKKQQVLNFHEFRGGISFNEELVDTQMPKMK
jgi:hypothetical protein